MFKLTSFTFNGSLTEYVNYPKNPVLTNLAKSRLSEGMSQLRGQFYTYENGSLTEYVNYPKQSVCESSTCGCRGLMKLHFQTFSKCSKLNYLLPYLDINHEKGIK